MNWTNLYSDRDGQWLKGNLHTHTSPASGCSVIPINDCLDRYVELGYDFVSVSDHMTYTDVSDDRIILISGIEWNSERGEHMGVYCTDSSVLLKAIESTEQDPLLEYLSTTDALVVLNHPNWQHVPHYRREELDRKQHYAGIEVYNGVIERLDGAAISSDKWDYLLVQGKKVLGFANDDSHCHSDIGLACNVVRSKSNEPADILDALKSGNFYGSSGVMIDDIRRTGDVIEIETSDAQEIRVIVDGGPMVQRVQDTSISFDTSELQTQYVRFELFGQGSNMAWTQPFFLR
jgi:hypothetical protein